ncbi:MAG: hypothetical protein NT069_02685 [Planctomycetota bacterium]|nr:hypothetical protein [Planctomycetota bacterium]
MLVRFRCPHCEAQLRQLASAGDPLTCPHCQWSRPTPAQTAPERPAKCLVCGCEDLWRQKDFPQKLGVAMVALGAIGSTLAIAFYMPGTAMAVLLFFAFTDLLLYTLMPDVLVCYRCSARYRDPTPGSEFPAFNLETAERYRQEAARVAEARASAPRAEG